MAQFGGTDCSASPCLFDDTTTYFPKRVDPELLLVPGGVFAKDGCDGAAIERPFAAIVSSICESSRLILPMSGGAGQHPYPSNAMRTR